MHLLLSLKEVRVHCYLVDNDLAFIVLSGVSHKQCPAGLYTHPQNKIIEDMLSKTMHSIFPSLETY